VRRTAAVVILLTLACLAQSDMTPIKTVDHAEFTVVGISARTNNAQEAAGNGVIPKQWEKFYKEDILGKIPDKTDHVVYAVYTDYASDKNGDYTFVIGAKVNDASKVPPGMVARKVPKGKYAVVTTARGPVWQVVPKAWQEVWSLEDKSKLGGARAYKADFEVYDDRSQNPQDSQVDLLIGLK
jgi:predicted transcriptional regulator YdeE